MKSNYFENKVIIITGSSSGIGRSLALNLSKEKASLVLAARNEKRLEEVAEACRKNNSNTIVMPTNVTVESQCRELIQNTVNAFGRIDMVINNAGIDVISPLDELNDLHLFKEVMDVNFFGAVYCTYYAIPFLKATQGRIVNISSMAGIIAIPHNTSYVASKFAMNGFADSLRMELIRSGVSVTVICPYWVASEFHQNYLDKYGKTRETSGKKLQKDKMMSPDRCAQIIIDAAYKRKREVLLGPGKLAAWIKLITPRLVDKITVQTILKHNKRQKNS